jgi:hypothetical protein
MSGYRVPLAVGPDGYPMLDERAFHMAMVLMRDDGLTDAEVCALQEIGWPDGG